MTFLSENSSLTSEREKQPIFGCITFSCKQDELKNLYQEIFDELASGRRKNALLQYVSGMAIDSDDIQTSELRAMLEMLRKVFLTKKEIEFESCYVDMLGKDTVNCGVYFSNGSQLEKLKTAFGDDLKISFILDVDNQGRYVDRTTKEQYSQEGHLISIPHLSKFRSN